MGQVRIVKGDLFAGPAGSIIAHACNCQGVWGSGIAKTFGERYPGPRDAYSAHCKSRAVEDLIGTCLLLPAGAHVIGCLFTSRGFGTTKDTPADILSATRTAVSQMLAQNTEGRPIAMCKINAGLFAVPWEQTQAVLEEFAVDFTVYEL